MKNKDRVALGRVVMARREHMMALESLGKGLLGTTLRYDYEVRPEKDYFGDIPSPKIDREMVQLAEHILESKAAHFDASKFKDRYEDALKALVKRKAAGQKIEPAAEPERPSNVVNLMEALRQSLGKGAPAGKSASHANRPTKKRSPRSRSGAKARSRRRAA
jgi:DNA end-binding protein Ku